MSRHLVRTGFTLVMPRWRGWTSDLREMAGVFAGYYPRRAAQLRTAAEYGYSPSATRTCCGRTWTTSGPGSPASTRVHGVKTPRPD